MADVRPHPTPAAHKERRSFLSFRRKSDLIWFILALLGLSFGFYAFVYDRFFRRPIIVEKLVETVKVVKVPVSAPAPAPVKPAPEPPSAPAPAPVPAPPPPPAEEGKPQLREKPWKTFRDDGVKATAGWQEADGEKILQIDYDFTEGKWVVTAQEADPDFESVSAIEFEYRSSGPNNTLEFKAEDMEGANIGMIWHGVTASPKWTKMSVDRSDLKYLWGGGGKEFDWSRVKLVDFGISMHPTLGDEGGTGRVQIRRIRFN